ncbi:MAG TPA: thiol:disulfide interchange protein DsbA/DsbL [Gammaproteobacteria bacterium]
MKRYFAWLFLLFMVPALALAASEPEYNEGIDYQRLSQPQPVASDGSVEVVELFWYGCPHCYHFEPHLQGWLKKKPAKVNFIRIPAIFNSPEWQLHATAFYTAEVLGIGEKIHGPLFYAIQEKKRPLHTREQLMEFFGEQGISKDDFNNTFDSFAVQTKVQRAADLSRKYELAGVPTMIVNGKYRVDGPMATSYERLIKIVDYLVREESKVAKKQ